MSIHTKAKQVARPGGNRRTAAPTADELRTAIDLFLGEFTGSQVAKAVGLKNDSSAFNWAGGILGRAVRYGMLVKK